MNHNCLYEATGLLSCSQNTISGYFANQGVAGKCALVESFSGGHAYVPGGGAPKSTSTPKPKPGQITTGHCNTNSTCVSNHCDGGWCRAP